MASATHLVVIPSYNTGPLVLRTVREARAAWSPVWVVVDGSTDGTAAALRAAAQGDPDIEVFVLPVNQGKGAAVLHGLAEAARRGFSHALVMDADGQHPAGSISAMMAASQAAPGAMVLGLPVFGPEAPWLRVQGRRISNWWARLETLGDGIGDSLFGFRVYPVVPLLEIMRRHRWMRRFDFDPEAAVRLSWRGVAAINLAVPVRYLPPEEGGVSHFHYVRDNVRLTWMHARLVIGMLGRLPGLVWRRAARRPGPAPATARRGLPP
jgi:glycosyltransferase involved in cell wall biosynthesis